MQIIKEIIIWNSQGYFPFFKVIEFGILKYPLFLFLLLVFLLNIFFLLRHCNTIYESNTFFVIQPIWSNEGVKGNTSFLLIKS